MTADEMRTHVVLPKALVKKIDARVGPRQRSKFIVDLTTREIANLELLEAAEAAAGALADHVPPEWESAEAIAQWVHDLRREESPRQERIRKLQDQAPQTS